MIKSKISDLDKMKIEEQKRAVRSGYDMDVLPSDLVTYGEEAKNLLDCLLYTSLETAGLIMRVRQGIDVYKRQEQICLLYYQVFVGMLEININSAEVLYKQKEETINE